MAFLTRAPISSRASGAPSGRDAGEQRSAVGEGRLRQVVSLATAALCAGVGAAAIAAKPVLPHQSAVVVAASTPATVRAGEARDIVATIANRGTSPITVLPTQARVCIEGPGAQYVPYPGPPVDPWEVARDLAPGEPTAVLFPDTADRRGIWNLSPGTYRVIATYDVPPDLVPLLRLARSGLVWRGRVESAPATMTVLPAR